ncbi:MAG: hypothetical protein GY847_29655 [Proteobacteria bacterium]|nr:hypothetical protein [Pseudomonadota bacterium]
MARANVSLSPSEIKTLARGGLVKSPLAGSGINSTIAGASFILIDSPPDIVLRAFEDVSAWTSIFPNTYKSRIVAAWGNVKVVKMRLGNRLFKFDFYFTVTSDREKRVVVYALNENKPHDIDECRGSIKFIPQPGDRTLVAFTSLVKVPFGAIIRLMGKKAIGWIEHRVLIVPRRLKKWVEGPTGAKYRSAAQER